MNKNNLFFIISLLLMITACSANPPVVLQPKALQSRTDLQAYTSHTLTVMTLNLAHGRKDGLNQIFMSKSEIHNNIEDISTFLTSRAIDVVALQEADAPSWWSGNFNHIALLAEQANYSAYIQTSHANSWLFSYGTALLSRLPFTATLQHTFEPSPPTMNKGFTLGQIAWQPDEGSEPILIDIVSVHLDFSRKSIREQQIEELRDTIADRGHPIIIMGDFNSDWFADEKVLRALTENSEFHVYRPNAQDLGTYGSSSHRLDWIVISKELEFKNLTTYADILSDHFAVMAEISIKVPDRNKIKKQ